MSDIFISYAREDRPKAKQLAEILECQGWSVWWDRTIPAGKSYDEVIDEAIKNTDTIIVLWSGISVKKNWVLEEAQDGMNRNILIPVLIEQVEPPRGFRRIHAANLVGWNGSPSAPEFIRLVRDIERIAGSPKGSPASPNVPGDGSAKRGGASVDPIEINIPQRMVNLPVLSAKIRRNSVIAILLVGMLIIGGIFIANGSQKPSKNQLLGSVNSGKFNSTEFLASPSDSSSETHILISATNKTANRYPYAEGLKLFEAGKYKQAYLLFLTAAKNGNASASFYLGYMYEHGYGVAKSYEEAVKWYRKSADKGDKIAQNNLGVMYRYGLGVQLDYAEAAKWYKKSADQGNAMAQYNLGYLYDNGMGMPKNSEEAMKWYQKAAVQGDPEAQYYLALKYEVGQGVAQNEAEAVKWYRLSAKQGGENAQNELRRRGLTW